MDLARSVQAWEDISWRTTQNTLSHADEARALAHWDFLVRRNNELTLDRLIGLASQSSFNKAALKPIKERLKRLRQLSPILPFISRGEALVLDRLDQLVRSSKAPTLLNLIAHADGDMYVTGIVLERLQDILYARIPSNTGIPHLSNKGALIEKIRVLMTRPNLAPKAETETKPQPHPFFVVLGNDATTLDDTSRWMEVVQKRFVAHPVPKLRASSPKVDRPSETTQRHGGGARSSAAKVTSRLSAEASEWGGDWYSGQGFETDFMFPMTRGILRF